MLFLCAVSWIWRCKIHAVCSCATGGRVPSTVLHSATNCMAAARAQSVTTAGRTGYGQAPRQASQVKLTTEHLNQEGGLLMNILRTNLPTPFLCAVSWICSILQKMSYKDTCLQTTGLQLCDWYESSKYGAAQCGPFYGGCQGAMNNYCFPYVVWSSKQPSSTTHWSPELNGGKFFETLDPTGHNSLHAFTVRCVLDLKQLNPYWNLRKIFAA